MCILYVYTLMFISRVIKDEAGCLRAVMPGGVGGMLGNKPSGGVKCAVYRAQRSVWDTELQFHLAVEVVLHILRFVITLKRRDDYHIRIPCVSSPSRWDSGEITWKYSFIQSRVARIILFLLVVIIRIVIEKILCWPIYLMFDGFCL